jgi:peptidoglycan glycosyltransferase
MHSNKNRAPITVSDHSGWRACQDRLKKTSAGKKGARRLTRIFSVLFILAAVGWAAVAGVNSLKKHFGGTAILPSANAAPAPADLLPGRLDKSKLQSMLISEQFLNLNESSFYITAENRRLRIDTSLDTNLQNYLHGKMNTSYAKQIAMVVLAPGSGKVISMVSFDKNDPGANTCLNSHYPAASVFKIVTAAAAIDIFNFGPDTVFSYNGGKHTLYKRQLKEVNNRYTNRITLGQSFAQSVNPVFGKLGTHHLGKANLEKFSGAFGFNRQFGFEIFLEPSKIEVTDDPYNWAELASGFNRNTTISPLHGALIAATVANNGQLVEPTIIDRITDEQGQVVYAGTLKKLAQVISPDASQTLSHMMTSTIRSGTLKKVFRGYRNDKILSRLTIGGKSGSIDNRRHDARYDWFVGFAKEKEGSGKIAIAVLVAHEKYIGLRAAYYAKLAMKRYFRDKG